MPWDIDYLRKLADESHEYYSYLNISPDGEDIWNDVCQAVADDMGRMLTNQESDEIWEALYGEE